MDELISRRAALDAIDKYILGKPEGDTVEVRALLKLIANIYRMPSVQPEYTEQDMREQFNAGYACGMHAAQPESKREWYMKGYRDAQQRWIPVTEALPEEKQDVLLAFKHNMVVGFWEDILNDGGQAWYANSGNGWFTGTEAVDDDGFPLAWMPLPEGYKEGQDEVN